MKTKRTNRFLSIRLTLVMVVGMLLITAFAIPPASAAWDGSTTDSDWEGGGTQQDPYLISSAEELAGMAAAINGNQYRDQHFKLTADIDLGNQPWTPIGTWSGSSRAFEGTFNGNGHRITGLNVSVNVHYAGLFGYIDGAKILNVEVYGSASTTFMNEGYAGGIAGYAAGGSYIANCASGVTVRGQNAGGIAGFLGSKSYLVNCYSTGTITSSLDEHGNGTAGGIAGKHTGTLSNCYSTSSACGGAQNGMISGYNVGGTINFGYYLDGDIAACGESTGNTAAYYFTDAGSNVFAAADGQDQNKKLVDALNGNRSSLESILGGLDVSAAEWVVNASVNNGYPVFATNSDLPEVTPYQIWVGGTQITSENAGNVLGDETVSYHASTNTLTLNGATISTGTLKNVNGASMNCGIFVDTEDSQGINIHLTGTNAINLSGGTNFTCGIGVEAGSGSLTLTAEEGASLDVNATNRGLFAYDGIHISGGTYTLTVDNGATWTNPAIESHGNSVIENADVTAESSGDNAINATALEIRSSTVSAKGKYDGIKVTDNLTIANSTVTAVGDDNGIRSYEGEITISGANTVVTAESKTAPDTTYYNTGFAIQGGSTEDETTYDPIAMPITLNDGLTVTEPAGGKIGEYGDQTITFRCALTADGAPTNKAVIKAPDATAEWLANEGNELYVGGVPVTAENAADITGDGITAGTASFAVTEGVPTLTLTGINISAGNESSDGWYQIYGIYAETASNNGIHIVLKGENTVSPASKEGWNTNGIHITSDTGTGVLSITAEEGASLTSKAEINPIYAYDGLKINGGTYRLTADFGDQESGEGIYCVGPVVIENANVTAESKNCDGIAARNRQGTSLLIKNSTVSATGGSRSYGGFNGIVSDCDIVIEESTVTAVGDDNGIRSYEGEITISGANTVVTAESKSELDTERYNSGLAIKGGMVEKLEDDTHASTAMPITLNDGLGVTEPEGGTIDTFTDEFGQAFYCVLTADGTLANKTVIKAHSHCVCGGKDNVSNHTHSESVKYLPWDGTTALEGGNNYYLTEDATVDSVTISGVKGVNLCLNGHTLNSSLKINDNLNICDCGEDGKITSSDAAVISYQNPDYSDSVSLYSGSLIGTGGNETVQGNDNTGNAFYFYGGTVSHTGDLIPFISSGKIYFYGGTVNSNSHGAAADAGGLIHLGDTKINHGAGYASVLVYAAEAINGFGYTGNDPVSIAYHKLNPQDGEVVVKNIDPQYKDQITLSYPEGKILDVANSGLVGVKNLVLATPSADHNNHCICGGTADITGHEHAAPVEYTEFPTLAGNALAAGNYYLKEDYAGTPLIQIRSGTVNLCLNGKTLTGYIQVFPGAALNLCDCQGSGKIITGNSAVTNMGTLNMYGGSLEAKNYTNAYGINNTNGGTANIYGGTVSGFGHGMYINSGKVNIYGGTVQATGSDPNGTQSADFSGIYIYCNSSTTPRALNISGGEVKGSSASTRGKEAIWSEGNNAINISDSAVLDGSIFMNPYKPSSGSEVAGTVNVTGGKISGSISLKKNCVANISGGELTNVSLYDNGATANISGGKISGAEYGIKSLHGKGVYIGGTPVITGTKAGIYTDEQKIRAYCPVDGNDVPYSGNKITIDAYNVTSSDIGNLYVYTVTDDNYNKFEVINVGYLLRRNDTGNSLVLGVPHEHRWDTTTWEKDTNGHWHKCLNSNCDITANTEKDGYAVHNYNQEIAAAAYLKTPATCTSPAVYYKSCQCGESSLGKTGETTFTNGTVIDHDFTVLEKDETNHWYKCSGCDATDTKTAHSFTVLQHDADYHWYKCSGCEATTEKTVHTPNADDGNCTTAITCSACPEITTPAKTSHDFSGAFDAHNASGHWHICNTAGCTQIDTPEEHTYGRKDSGVQATAATCTDKATNYVQCDYCDQVSDTVTVAVGELKPHDFSGSFDEHDETGHWHICNAAGCDAADTPEAHGYGSAIDTTCDDCGYVRGYTVTFNINADGAAGEVPATALYDNAAVQILIPYCTLTRDGYTFMGWSTDAEYVFTRWDADKYVFFEKTSEEDEETGKQWDLSDQNNTELYAVWAKNVLTVTDSEGALTGSYPILAMALEKAPDGSTITVTESYTDNEVGMLYDENEPLRNVILDLNGKEIQSEEGFYTGCNLTVTGNGTYGGQIIQSGGTLTIENGSYGMLMVQFGNTVLHGGPLMVWPFLNWKSWTEKA